MTTQYVENPNAKVFNVDFDGTLTTGEYTENPGARADMIERLRVRYETGHIIIIWTARQWDQAPFMVSWLIKHCVPFHGVMMAKGGSNYYIDDKMMSFEDF